MWKTVIGSYLTEKYEVRYMQRGPSKDTKVGNNYSRNGNAWRGGDGKHEECFRKFVENELESFYDYFDPEFACKKKGLNIKNRLDSTSIYAQRACVEQWGKEEGGKKRPRSTSLHISDRCDVKDFLVQSGIEPNPGPKRENVKAPSGRERQAWRRKMQKDIQRQYDLNNDQPTYKPRGTSGMKKQIPPLGGPVYGRVHDIEGDIAKDNTMHTHTFPRENARGMAMYRKAHKKLMEIQAKQAEGVPCETKEEDGKCEEQMQEQTHDEKRVNEGCQEDVDERALIKEDLTHMFGQERSDDEGSTDAPSADEEDTESEDEDDREEHPQLEDCKLEVEDEVIIWSINTTSLNTAKEALAKVKAHLIFIQEHSCTPAMLKRCEKYLRARGWSIHASPAGPSIKGLRGGMHREGPDLDCPMEGYEEYIYGPI